MKIVETEISLGNHRYSVVEDNGDRVTAPEYFLVVNDTWELSSRSWSHLTIPQAKSYMSLVEDLRSRKHIVFKKPGNIFSRKTYTFIPVLTPNGWNGHHIVYYLKGSWDRRGRHCRRLLTFGNPNACEKYFKEQTFEPKTKIVA